MEGDFQVYDIPTQIDCRNIFSLVEGMEPQVVFIRDIFHKELSSINPSDERYIKADLSYPCLLIHDLPNPEKKKYRMIDGRHRVLKTLLQGKNFINAYILSFTDIQPFIEKKNEKI